MKRGSVARVPRYPIINFHFELSFSLIYCQRGEPARNGAIGREPEITYFRAYRCDGAIAMMCQPSGNPALRSPSM
jgi:hypothetical protein